MDTLYFKCSCCKQEVRMKKETIDDFADWAYYEGVEWSDFNEDVPDFSEKHWNRSENTPAVNENRTLHVWKPFDESIGNEFLILFEPALCYFNGWDEVNINEIKKCAIVRCKFTKILKRNEFEAWIVVNIKEVIPVHELYKYFKPCTTEKDIMKFNGIPEDMSNTVLENNEWSLITWDAQGDCGENKWIFKDDKGIPHLVMQSWFDFDNSVVYIGNIIKK